MEMIGVDFDWFQLNFLVKERFMWARNKCIQCLSCFLSVVINENIDCNTINTKLTAQDIEIEFSVRQFVSFKNQNLFLLSKVRIAYNMRMHSFILPVNAISRSAYFGVSRCTTSNVLNPKNDWIPAWERYVECSGRTNTSSEHGRETSSNNFLQIHYSIINRWCSVTFRITRCCVREFGANWYKNCHKNR